MDIARLHVLVAEADPAQRSALKEMLGRLGVNRIDEATDGDSALRLLQGGALAARVDVAIVDLDLAGMDGIELMRQVAALGCPTRLIVTGAQPAHLMFGVETLAQAYGVELLGALAKPLHAARLKTLLDNYLPVVTPLPDAAPPQIDFGDIGAGLQERQFEPFFQPKIELATGQVKGLEVFARWRHPTHGLLTPEMFIGALEAQGRMDFLDWTMIEQSLERCRWFHDQGIPIPISINLAPATLAHPGFIRQMGASLERHGLLPDYVTFEMPESSVLAVEAGLLERLLRLRMMGFGLAVDDYGTGRSNLQLLARVPFSELKIDRSFVDGASKKLPLSTVLRSCLGLAHNLSRHSVAVGVETRQDWDFLQDLGCTYAQGYYIANPMEAAAFPGWLDDWRHYF